MSNKIDRDLNSLHPAVAEMALKVLDKAEEAGLNIAIFETGRTLTRQKWLKSNQKSKTLNSYHRLGLAVDFVFLTKSGNWTWDVPLEKWKQLADIMEECGFRSLGKRSGWDWPHAELRFKGTTTTHLFKRLKEQGSLEDFWKNYVDLKLYKKTPINISVTTKETIDIPDNVEVVAETGKPSIIEIILNFIKGLFSK